MGSPKNVVSKPKFNGEIDKDFDCGDKTVNRFYHKRFKNQHDAGVVAGHVWLDSQESTVAFAALSSAQVDREKLGEFGKELPYPTVPFTRIGWLGVDKYYQGKGIGKQFLASLIDMAESITDVSASLGVFVDALPDAVDFYIKFGFIEFELEDDGEENHNGTTPMFLPFKKKSE